MRVFGWAIAILGFEFLFGFRCVQPAFAQFPERVIIDTDPGTDDALAILWALQSPELRSGSRRETVSERQPPGMLRLQSLTR